MRITYAEFLYFLLEFHNFLNCFIDLGRSLYTDHLF